MGSANLPKSLTELLGGYAGAKSADFAENGAIKNPLMLGLFLMSAVRIFPGVSFVSWSLTHI